MSAVYLPRWPLICSSSHTLLPSKSPGLEQALRRALNDFSPCGKARYQILARPLQ